MPACSPGTSSAAQEVDVGLGYPGQIPVSIITFCFYQFPPVSPCCSAPLSSQPMLLGGFSPWMELRLVEVIFAQLPIPAATAGGVN